LRDPISKRTISWQSGLSSKSIKCEALSSNPNTQKSLKGHEQAHSKSHPIGGS
jgi:hypothetical protein